MIVKFRVCLYSMSGAALIVPSSTGCIYYNQVGGTMCYQPEVEGFFVPVNFDNDPNNFEESLEYKLTQLFSDVETIDQEKARAIEELLNKHVETRGISLDYEKLDESVESWVYVSINDIECGDVEGMDNIKGILTWPNSD